MFQVPLSGRPQQLADEVASDIIDVGQNKRLADVEVEPVRLTAILIQDNCQGKTTGESI